MYPQQRQDEILKILEKNNYVTVAYLIERLCYSSATINRDLNVLEKRGLVSRSYGGVELTGSPSIPVEFRVHKQHRAKESIARKAAELVQDGDTVFIDGSTTAQYMGPHLVERKRLTVITNNITLASYLSEHGVTAIVLGGKIIEAPSMLGGVDTVDMARTYRADKAFFSTWAATADGQISCGSLYHELHRVMIENSAYACYLIDGEKCAHTAQKILCDFGAVHCVISDRDFSSLQNTYPNTELILVK